MILLEAPYPAIQTATGLPNPQLSDVQSRKISLEIRRSMNNTKRTYVQTNQRQALTYVIRMSRQKSLELEEFIKAYYAADVRLTNHKGEVWLVKFTANPFEFAEAGRDNVTITLNFEGTLQ